MPKKYFIGIMSGTSLDGIDVAICQIDEKQCQCIASLEYPMPLKLKQAITHCIENDITIDKVGEIDHQLAKVFAKSVNALLTQSQINANDIEAIGSHGQTLWHSPNTSEPFTMQVGDPNIITVRTKIPVVADFRRKDIALQGQGAPFAPAFHAFLFSEYQNKVAVVNIGGMANITILNEEKLLGYDTGCGNRLLDLWILKHKNIPYDKDGEWAKEGSLIPSVLDTMLQDTYFKQSYPKSTGREKFNLSWIETYIKDKSYKAIDIQRTLLELTAKSICDALLTFDRKHIILCGGGTKNIFLVSRIKTLLPQSKVSIAKDSDMLEAMAFAWLAYKRVNKEPVNLKDVTGATHNAILGGLYE